MNSQMTRNTILHLPLDNVNANPHQPRLFFDNSSLQELADSIRTYGVLQPISVRRVNSRYELVAGERRLRASKIAGLSTIPAILVDVSDTDSAVLAIIENLQRQNLHFFEEAEGFRNLIANYAFTQEVLAERIGKNQSTIANKLRILKLPRTVQIQIIESDLTERHARALLKLTTEGEQLEVLQKTISQGLTVRKTEELIDAMLSPKKATQKAKMLPFKAYIRDVRILTNSIKENLDMVRRGGLDSTFDMEETSDGYSITIQLSYKKKAEQSA